MENKRKECTYISEADGKVNSLLVVRSERGGVNDVSRIQAQEMRSLKWCYQGRIMENDLFWV